MHSFSLMLLLLLSLLVIKFIFAISRPFLLHVRALKLKNNGRVKHQVTIDLASVANITLYDSQHILAKNLKGSTAGRVHSTTSISPIVYAVRCLYGHKDLVNASGTFVTDFIDVHDSRFYKFTPFQQQHEEKTTEGKEVVSFDYSNNKSSTA